MSYYNQQQPPVGVPPPQGYPPEGYAKGGYPPPGYPPQAYPPQGYPPQQGYPPAYAPQYAQQPQRQNVGFAEGCLAALCCENDRRCWNFRVVMGAPKQKWTSEEEAALKAGVLKHGAGKWRTILKDPEFSGVLYLRSNVDLKDKWRNMSVMTNGLGSREKSRLALKRLQPAPKQDENPTNVSEAPQSDEEIADVKPLPSSSATIKITAPKRSIVRLDNLILEAITNLREPGGSNKTAIASYIEDQYWAPPDFKRLLSGKLKFLVSSGKLIKVKRNYRIAPFPASSYKRRNLQMIPQEARQQTSGKVDGDELRIFTKSQIDLELAKMRNMSAQEAAAAAARAVAEAEAAIEEAEEAAREAEAAEADAEAAQAFAEAAMKTLRGRSTPKMVVPIANMIHA
ncbi:hypothetical protein Nepgr_019763 [Nepenthes gracilis]|uniref:MYB transcription factor n=1 Tax=Nepenthes gracilis TaxID=150966 RepID=A0AAD3XUF0_NEPGR|nr:hypothetical protein Nepgr_019763 [Nepenthes gracilis]